METTEAKRDGDRLAWKTTLKNILTYIQKETDRFVERQIDGY